MPESHQFVQKFHAACVGAARLESKYPKEKWYTLLDQLGAGFGVAPRMMVLHAVTRLSRITAEEVAAHPGLSIAHWLVLAELVPEPGEFRTAWIVRCEQMRFTAKMLRAELADGVAARDRLRAKDGGP